MRLTEEVDPILYQQVDASRLVFPHGGMTALPGISDEWRSIVVGDLTRQDRSAQAGEDIFINLWRERDGHVLVPRYYNLSRLSGMGDVWVNSQDVGSYKHELLYPPREHQREIAATLDALDGDIGIRAPCAWGKTYIAAYLGSLLIGRVLIIVPNQNKMNEWKREMARFYGLDSSQVGTIQAGKRDWDKPVVVAMAKTMSLQEFPPEIENGFVLTVIDEGHLTTAAIISRALGKIGGRRLALTATPGRGLRREILELHYGNRWLNPKNESMPCRFEFVTVPVWSKLKTASWEWLRVAIGKDDGYSHSATGIVKQLLGQGRRVLVVNSQIRPLMEIYRGTEQQGGFIVGQESLKGIVKCFPRLGKNLEAREGGSWPKRVNNYMEEVKTTLNPILGIGLTSTQPAGTGMDVPDLDGGVIMLPIASPDMVTQLLGRWARVHPGKKNPVIVVMVPDTGEAISRASTMMGHLRRAGVEVVDHGALQL